MHMWMLVDKPKMEVKKIGTVYVSIFIRIDEISLLMRVCTDS